MKEKINPRRKANILSVLFFGYTLQLLKKGLKKDLDEEDLYGFSENCESKTCGDKTERQWEKSRSIYVLLYNRFGSEYFGIGLATILWTQINSIGQPYGQSKLISYFEQGQTKITKIEAYYSAGIVIVLKLFSIFMKRHIAIFRFYLSIKIRASLKSLLYRKALRLSPSAFGDTNLGNIVTILTKDIDTVETNLWIMMELVIITLQACTISYLLWYKMGNSAFVGIGLLLLALPIEIYMTSLLTKIRLRVGKYTDSRLLVTQETLSAIKIVKMYCWEKFFIQNISEARKKEMSIMMTGMNLKNAIIAFTWCTCSLTFLVLILFYLWMGNTTSTELIFYVLSLFYELREIYGANLPTNILKGAEIMASLMRLSKFLNADELVTSDENRNKKEKPLIELEGVTVKMKDDVILKDVCMKIDTPGLILVSGPVGSGKSTLLKAILKEYTHEGNIQVHGTVSFASQEPWLFPASIKDNILFGQKYDSNRYNEVVRICALEYDFALLEFRDETLVADSGINLSKGQQARVNLARAIYKNSDIYLLDDSLTALDTQVQNFIFDQCITRFLHDKMGILVTQNVSHLNEAEKVIILNSDYVPSIDYRKRSSTVQSLTSLHPSNSYNKTAIEDNHVENKIYHETKKIGKVDWAVYKKYFDFGGGIILFGGIMSLYLIGQFVESYTEQLLTEWVDLQQAVLDLAPNSTNNETYYQEKVSEKDSTFTWYIVMTIAGSALWFIKFYIFVMFCRRASIKIHRLMSLRVVNSIMAFFDTHYLGNILNRFAYDLSNIDEYLPYVFPEVFAHTMYSLGALVLLIKVNWIFIFPSGLFILGLILIRMSYIPTGRSLKRLEAATRSPLVGRIHSSLEGLTTIRAFKAEQILKDEFDVNQDQYTSAYFTLVCTMTGFEFFIDVLCATFLILVILRFILFDHDLSAGNVGLALTQVFALTTYISIAVRLWADLETYMTSAERVLEYTGIKNEDLLGKDIENWPKNGDVVFDKVRFSYDNTTRPVLDDVSFSVKPGQKIGIVGRTGAGKSSVISTLFRLYEINQGKILIDGVDIKEISLVSLRKNIAIIPQDPVLFTGSIRSNIDPNNLYTDEEIWRAIEKVQIKHLVPSLDLPITESGSSFSIGQKQLICLARVAVGKYKIVVLDEATANMDSATDEMLHSVIKEIFADCTVLMIAHRLESIMDCDMVMVIDKGRMVEIDTPSNLLQNSSSVFCSMYKESDESTSIDTYC